MAAGPHDCGGCPGGGAGGPDLARLLRRDGLAACFLDCCRQVDALAPESSRMRSSAEWAALLRRLEDRGLAAPEDPALNLLRGLPSPIAEPEVVSVHLEKALGCPVGADIDMPTLEIAAIDPSGLLASWSRAHPPQAIRPGDRVLEVNGISDAAQALSALSRHGSLEVKVEREGLDLCRFLRLLQEQVHGQSTRHFDEAARAMRGALHSVNIWTSVRGLESLTQEEMRTYQLLLCEYEHGVADSLKGVLSTLRRAEQAEDAVAAVAEPYPGDARAAAALDPGPLPTTPEEFQWTRGPDVERRLREIRIPGILFSPYEVVLDRTDWGLRRYIATVAGTGAEVEVVEVPWDVPADFAAAVVELSNRLEALKQLTLSRYYRDYLGYDFSSCSGVGLHFLPLKQGICLRHLVALGGALREESLLLRYWLREILQALRDYLYQCCQELTEDITLAHVFVHQEGLEVLLRGVPFGERRGILFEDLPEYGPGNKWRNCHDAVEQRLISMFGGMAIELLCGPTQAAPLEALGALTPPLRSAISQALNARDSYDRAMMVNDCQVENVKLEVSPPQDFASAIGLASGFVGAGIEEYVRGDEYSPWWTAAPQAPFRLLPNVEESADAGGKLSAGDWGSGQAKPEAETARWEPNATIFTLQDLLNLPALQLPQHDVMEIMDAWDAQLQRYQEAKANSRQVEAFLNSVLL